MEPIMQLINTLNALNAAMQKLTEKMTSAHLRRSAQDLSLKKNQNL